jgi:hypothetical protein
MSFSLVDNTTLYGILVGLVPSFLLLIHLLDPYEDELKDEILWRGFMNGFLLGIVAYVLEWAGFLSYGLDGWVALLSVFGFAIIHPLMMGMFLNKRKYQKERDVLSLGAALGFGFSSSYGFTIFAGGLLTGDINTPYEQIIGILYVLGTILLLGSTGVIIAYGVFSGEYQRYILYTITLHLIPNFMKFLRVLDAIPQGVLAVSLFLYGALVYYMVVRDFIPHISAKTISLVKSESKLFIKPVLK